VTGGAAGIGGKVDSSFVAVSGTPKVYVYAGNVTPDDFDGDSGDPLLAVPVEQDANACTFSYHTSGLAAGQYTVAFVAQSQNDAPSAADTLTFQGTTTVTVGASGETTKDFAPASVLRVGSGKTYSTISAAAAAASAGSVIEVDAGTYNDDVVVWRDDRVVVRGVGGRAHVHATHIINDISGDDKNNGKGIFLVQADGMRIENIELSGSVVPDDNGAGIRNEGRDLTVCNGYFHDNQNGFLGEATGTLTFEYSTFAHNGTGDGFTHNVYVDGGDKLIFRHNYSHHASIGHTLKTRSKENYILYNRIMDEADGTSSYTIDVPNGGFTVILGNLLQQGPDTDNSTIVAYGAEGLSSGRTHNLYVVNNTVVNDRGSGTFFDVASGSAVFQLTNNLLIGGGTVSTGKSPASQANITTSSPMLVNIASFDYRPTSNTPGINAGVTPGSAGTFSLVPVYQYQHPAQRTTRSAVGTIDVGAYEFSP
jgi:hypothetical protein